jgi:MerR family copper efflux transcriptional regulator
MSVRLPISPEQKAPTHAGGSCSMEHAAPTVTPSRATAAGTDEALPLATGDDGAKYLRVGDLAQRTGKTVRAMHLYEELGLLKPERRSEGGFRLYGADALVRVRWISKLQEMGFSLPDIRELVGDLEVKGSASAAMTRVRALYAKKVEETRAQIERLRSLEGELERSIAYLDTCDTCDPDRLVTACARCDQQHHECQTAPELVAGLHAQRH